LATDPGLDPEIGRFPYPQDLHIHTTFSTGDTAVAPQQTVELVARFRHARVMGISDHLDYVYGERFDEYQKTVRQFGFRVGVEVDGGVWAERALEVPVDYYLLHCYDLPDSYRCAERLVETGKPVIISHPLFLGTNLSRVPTGCLLEINNRYVWRSDWRQSFGDALKSFRFVIGSDAHQPHWLTQHVARAVARELGIQESLLF
jgi:histidinol phosphatase-like PHP family hydrolase